MKIHSILVKAALFAVVAGLSVNVVTTANAFSRSQKRLYGNAIAPGSYRASHYMDPERKLGRGIQNATFGLFEFQENVIATDQESGPASAVTYGVVRGFGRSIGRTLLGVWEVITFPLPNRRSFGYDPLTEPEFKLHDWHNETVPMFDTDE